MQRRDFLKTTAATSLGLATIGGSTLHGFRQEQDQEPACCDRTWATVADAMKSPRETLLYVPAIYSGTDVKQPDYLATIDADPASATFGQVIHRLPMLHVGDELHHFGWNSCSSCHGQPGEHRRFMLLPGIASSRIYVVDTADPKAPKIHKVVEPNELKTKANLSAPHTVHCLADGHIMISCLGDAAGNGPGGFALLNQNFEVLGRWEQDATGMKYSYDFWYQPRQNVMVSSEWAAPNTVAQGFKVPDVQAGKYGQQIHFWNWKEKKIEQTIDLGSNGLIPLEVRFHHNPESTHGFVGAALSSTMWHWYKSGDSWKADQVIAVDPVNDVPGWDMPVPGLITDLVLSMDDRFLYFANWLHGDIRQYDVSDPAKPKLTGQVWLGGQLSKPTSLGRPLSGGPPMLQLSLDGKRLYATNSLYSPWDNQFYPGIKEQGSWLVQIDCDTAAGGMEVNPKFFVDFGREPLGPARAHEMRFPGGDSTSDIWS